MGMTGTRGRTGLLLMIAPWRRRVVILADRGITEKVGAGLWSGVVEALTRAFREHRYTEGLIAAIDDLGAALAPHLPPAPGDVNELPDQIDRGR
jgi:putative membrane protein